MSKKQVAIVSVEERLLQHKTLAESLADRGELSRALVVVDDGLGLHQPNAWYHHVDSTFLEARSREMVQYGNLCLLKAELLKKMSMPVHG